MLKKKRDHSLRKMLSLFIRVIQVLLILIGMTSLFSCQVEKIEIEVPLKLDQEKILPSGKALNSSTQSINRYNSILRKIKTSTFSFSPDKRSLDVHLKGIAESSLSFLEIQTDFLLPLLPYVHDAEIDDFDKANLLLAEFARNGINLSIQEENSKYGYVKASPSLFNDDGEYFYQNNEIVPNKGVRPLRMSMVNNCLHPGLWEINASDAVGEMYHSWLQLPKDFYFEMIRVNNNISTSVNALTSFFNKDDFTGIQLDLDRLRTRGKLCGKAKAEIAKSKVLGGYSTQDSRRKVQRKFYQIYKNGKVDSIQNFTQLGEEHEFQLHSFLPPGVYDHTNPFKIPYRPQWKDVSIYEVDPKTSYGAPINKYHNLGTIELVLEAPNQEQLIVGNIPVALLVFSADYSVPAFGVGVLSSSELIERRHLRLQDGPLPHYAYLAQKENDDLTLLNNHERGFEQIYLRPFLRNDQMYLRFTVVSYERIVDLLEFEFPITGELKDRIIKANSNYQPPVYEIYSDSNVL